ncbi:MAG: SpoIIIAH-like family protein [Eubacteriales bacterium]
MKSSSKIVLVCILIAAIVVTGYSNYRINNGGMDNQSAKASASPGEMAEQVSSQDTTAAFAQFRTDKEKTRDQEVAYLDSVINSKQADADAVKQAMTQKVALTTSMEQETVVEGLLKSSGYADAVCTISNNQVNVVVAAKTLTDDQAVKILEIVKNQTGASPQNIKIMPQG